jgi:hypothetical protein
MLGPPWSEDDLEMFYQAFRKHGKDWKKVINQTFILGSAVNGLDWSPFVCHIFSVHGITAPDSTQR